MTAKFDPLKMDFFSESGRKNYDKYLKEKEKKQPGSTKKAKRRRQDPNSVNA